MDENKPWQIKVDNYPGATDFMVGFLDTDFTLQGPANSTGY